MGLFGFVAVDDDCFLLFDVVFVLAGFVWLWCILGLVVD